MENSEILNTQPIFYRTVENSIINHRKNHAYLIEGYNALEYAKFLAKSLLCQEDTLCCGHCRICEQIENFSYIDLIFVDGKEESIKRDDITNIQNKILKKSVEGNGTVYIINLIENSTPTALNRLLKVLEEPQEGVYAIFTCENANAVLPTIISRCQVYRLRPLNKIETKKELLSRGIKEEKANLLLEVSSSLDEMLKYNEDETFDGLFIEALNFIDDYYTKRDNLMINTQTHLIKKYNDRQMISLFLDMVAVMYKDILNITQGMDSIFTDHPAFMQYQDDVEGLIHKIELVLDIQNDLRYNANVPLIIDHLIYNL